MFWVLLVRQMIYHKSWSVDIFVFFPIKSNKYYRKAFFPDDINVYDIYRYSVSLSGFKVFLFLIYNFVFFIFNVFEMDPWNTKLWRFPQ